MKIWKTRIYTALALLFIMSFWAIAQQGGGITTSTARHIRWGSSLPATCNTGSGDVFFKTSATIGLYICSATNTWTALSSSLGGGPAAPDGSIQTRANSTTFGSIALPNDSTQFLGGTGAFSIPASMNSSAFSSLATPPNGTYKYCTDCTVTSTLDNTCADSGSGAVAQRVNGIWRCSFVPSAGGSANGGTLVEAGQGLTSGTYTSGITATGTVGQTCNLTAFNNGNTGGTATVALTGTNTIAGGTALVITAAGSGNTSASTSATAGNGTATCSGTATVATILTGFSLTLTSTGTTNFTVPLGTHTGAIIDAAQSFTGVQTFTTPIALTSLASTVVNASSPGVGLCHFAGSTQTCTSSAVNLANADVTGLLGNGKYYGVLGSLFTATDETTTSTSFVDLTTADSVTFTCAATCNVIVTYLANVYNVGGTTINLSSDVLVDGSQVDDGNQVVTTPGASLPIAGYAVWRAASLSAASHTIKIQHKVSGQTGHWRDRMLVVAQTP